jgi:hypothetical protein
LILLRILRLKPKAAAAPKIGNGPGTGGGTWMTMSEADRGMLFLNSLLIIIGPERSPMLGKLFGNKEVA